MCFPKKMSWKDPGIQYLWFYGSLPKKMSQPYLKLETQLLGTVKGPGSESGWGCWMSQHFLNVKHRQSGRDAGLKTHQNTELDHSNWWIQKYLEFWKLQMQSTMAVWHIFLARLQRYRRCWPQTATPNRCRSWITWSSEALASEACNYFCFCFLSFTS